MEKNETSNNYIYGKNPVLEAVLKNPKRINKIFIQNNIGLDNRLKKIVELAKTNNIVINFTNLNAKTDVKIKHQGVLASVSPVEFIEFDEFIESLSQGEAFDPRGAGQTAKLLMGDVRVCKANSSGAESTSCSGKAAQKRGHKKIVILDGICDPHNLGAIIRTCACAGFDGVIISNHRSCSVTPVVEKTSAGAVNYIPIVKVNSLSSIVDELKNNNWWIIATEVASSDNYFDIDYTNMNFAIILGAEGKGVNKTLLNKADFKVRIPVNFESLNVSTACAVVVYEALRQIIAASES